jgi:serine/threonine-protein kinase
MSLELGTTIDGKYRIIRLIGTGGMGAVYEGENILIRRRVAIKVLLAATTQNPDLIRRFEREAQAAGEIGNDHILEVLDLGSLPNGDRYMVMEYLDGETLADRITRHGKLTPGQLAPIARQFLTALASAHAAGIIHRDLKPENIFILRHKAGRADYVKLIDFGVSKFSNLDTALRATRAGSLLGTPCYMSPEQARGRAEADVRSDIYACGVIMYESVTGKLPFEAETFNDLMFKIALSEPPSPMSLVPALDPDFAWLINHAMAHDPNARFQTVREFAEALDSWMRKNALTGTLTAPPPSDAYPSSRDRMPSNPRIPTASAESLDAEVDALALQQTTSDESWVRTGTKTSTGRRSRASVAIAVGAGVAILGIGIAVFAGRGPSDHAARSDPGRSATQAAAAPETPVDPPAANTAQTPPTTPEATAPATTPSAVSSSAASANGLRTADASKRSSSGSKPQNGSTNTKPKTRPASSGKTPDFGY